MSNQADEVPFISLNLLQYSQRYLNIQMTHYNVTSAELEYLFEPDNVREGQSIAKLKEYGGIDSFEKLLHTDFTKGIVTEEKDHKKRISLFGDNQPIVKPPKTIMELILQNFEDDMLKILCAAAVVSLVLGIATEGLAEGWLEGASILIAVVIIVTVTSGNNYIKEKQFQKLNAQATKKDVNCYRGGQLLHMSVYDLLVGDIVEVETGEILSVDGILIESNNLTTDESSMTGETHQIKKNIPITYEPGEGKSPFLISGSKIMEGTGKMLALAVGVHSNYGKLKLSLANQSDQTPLQSKLSVRSVQVCACGMYSSVATFTVMFVHYIYDCLLTENFMDMFLSADTLHQVIEYFIIAVSIIVVAVPEGLPLSVTIALAYSVGKMKDQNNLVRYLQACETMGGADNICSDKTGTLTKNLMTVTKIFVEEHQHDSITAEIMNKNTLQNLCLGVCNNSSANPIFKREGSKIIPNQIGNKTECALLEMAYVMNYDYKKYRASRERIPFILPFSSEKKKMATVYKNDKGSMTTFVKGAPDFLIPYCTKYINKQGNVKNIDGHFSELLDNAINEFANQSLRTLILAYKESNSVLETWDEIENNLIITAMVGIKDPLRDGIAEAIQACREGGVRVRMVTGDNKITAIAIAKDAGLLPEDYVETDDDCTVMEGKVFREFVGGLENRGSEDQNVGNVQNFMKVRDELCVLARSSPEDKYLMATGLKKLDHVVAMTGDGTNDAPALKKADIGFAMGIAGTEVAKEASGIILLDDNFRSIVTAMKWGRNIFDSIRKFLQFQLTVNFVALVMAFIGGAILRESPLNPIQMLWVNLIMDTLASLALATEPPSEELLKRKPYSRHESLITANMWKNIIGQGIMQIIVLGYLLFKGPELFDIPSSINVTDWNQDTGKHYSIFFNVFVLLQVFNEINARKLKPEEYNVFENFFNNPLFLVIIVGTILIQLIMVRFGGESLKTTQLSFSENLLCIVLGSLSLWSGLIIKILLPHNLIICSHGIEIGQIKYYWKEPCVEKED